MNRYRVSFDRSTDLYVETIVPHGRYCLAEDATDQLAAAQARIAELEEHILTLTKLPTWKPVEDGYTHLCGCIDCADGDPDGWSWQLYTNGDGVGIDDPDNKDDDRWVQLPDDVRLCRFTPAAVSN